jgi:hypothetical protein
MPKQKPLNWKYINKILKHIHKEPKRLWMGIEGAKEGKYTFDNISFFPPPKGSFPACGMQACFYGWSKILRTKFPKFNSCGELKINNEKESKLLGFTPEEQEAVYYTGAEKTDRELQRLLLKYSLSEIVAARIASGEKSAKRIRLDYLD